MAVPQNNVRETNSTPPVIHPMSLSYRFFCWCSGANLDILRRFPTEYNRYFGIGTMVFMTGFFAFLSSANAIASVFTNNVTGDVNLFPVLIFATAWSLFIFFLDRYFVSSISKADTKTEALWTATIRLLLAVFIGLVISHPLELRIFKPEIMEYLAKQKRDGARGIEKYHRDKIDKLQKSKVADSTIIKERRELDLIEASEKASVDAFYRDVVQPEMDGTGGSNKRGANKIFQEKNKQFKALEAAFQAKQVTRNARHKLLDSMEASKWSQIDKEIKNEEAMITVESVQANETFASSILKQSQALSAISSYTKNQEGSFYMKWGIIMLFVFLEIAPILAKLLSRTGPYDEAIRTLEQGYSADNLQDRHLIREELKLNRDLINRTAAAQREVMRQALRRWRAQELRNQEDSDDS